MVEDARTHHFRFDKFYHNILFYYTLYKVLSFKEAQEYCKILKSHNLMIVLCDTDDL